MLIEDVLLRIYEYMLKIRKQEIVWGVIIGAVISIGIIGLSPSSLLQIDKSRELYKEAKKYHDSKDFQAAYDQYEKIPSNYPAYNMVLFQKAKCAASLGNEKIAIEKLKRIVSDYGDSSVGPLASYNLAQAYIRIKDESSAEDRFLYTIENYSDTDFAIGSYYYMGELSKKNNPEATLKYWLKYIDLAPNGRFALECLNGALDDVKQLNTDEKLSVGIALYKNQKYKSAYNILAQVPSSKSWYYIARISEHLGDYPFALNLYRSGISKYASSATEDQLEYSMLAIVRLSGKPALETWSEIIKIASKSKDYAFFSKAKLVSYKDKPTFYKAIVDYFPQGDYASESLWNLFWYDYKMGKYSKAVVLGKKHIKLYSNKKASPKILFWTAKAYEKLHNNSLASNFYKKVLAYYPDSYYAFRASGRLKALNSGNDAGWHTNMENVIKKMNLDTFTPYPYSETKKKYGSDVAELVEVQDYDLLTLLKLDDPFIASWIKLKSGIYSKSIVLARDGMSKLMPKPPSNDNRWKLIYPIHFEDLINQYSEVNDLDPFITLALSKEESYFNPLALSSSNARGLMQILPGTAGDISRWKNLGSISGLELFNPDKNIKYGTAYLGYVGQLLDNNSLYAVAAYNSGPGAVSQWLKTTSDNDMDKFVENIPYKQTRNYVKKVFGSYWNYKRIYDSE